MTANKNIQPQSDDLNPDFYSLIDSLSEKQRDCLGVIFCQMAPSDYTKQTLNSLIKKGLIVEVPVEDGAFTWITYELASLQVHMAYCTWCSENISEEDMI